jgi:hypothetical protein
LKAFLGVSVLMGMKKQPNLKTYWQKVGSFFHCPLISQTFTRERFMVLRKCLHITDPASYANVDRGDVRFDKIRQVRWLVDKIRDACKAVWSLGKYLAIDEMMIRYKGSYSPIRQYMPNKPQKWGLKVWCLADAVSKYVYNFSIYCGKSVENVLQPASRGEPRLAHNVVLNMVEGLDGKGHVVVMDNYFSSVGLFSEMASRGIYATGTMRSNRIGLPKNLKDTKSFNARATQGELEWRMHESRGIACALWKDKRPVLLLSTHVQPIGFPCQPVDVVPRRNGAIRDEIQSSPMHKEYTTYMRGVDVADQLRASYSCQVRTHKWWHRIFYFLLDMTIVNMYIMYLSILDWQRQKKVPITHLQFRTELCRALLQNWNGRERGDKPILPRVPVVCCPSYHQKRRDCFLCGKKTNFFCYLCDCKFMCVKHGCYEIAHTPPHFGRT